MVDKLNMEELINNFIKKKIKLKRLLLPCRKGMYEKIYLFRRP